MNKMLPPILLLMLSIFFSHIADARQFRKMAPIPVAPEVLAKQNLEASSSQISQLEPIDANFIKTKLEEIIASWNSEALQSYLDRSFPNRWQLNSVLSRDIPKDAVLQLLTIQNISTINQQWADSTPGQRVRESTVIATVNMQIRFLDATQGVITLPHTSQFYLRVMDSE